MLGTFLACGCQSNLDQAAQEVDPIPVVVLKTNRVSEVSYPVTFYGRIQPERKSILAFEVPGKLLNVQVDEGQVVEPGDVLARLDISELAAEQARVLASKRLEQSILERLENGERAEVLDVARVNVRQAEARYRQAKREVNRMKSIYERGSANSEEYERFILKADVLLADLDAAKLRLAELESGTRKEDLQAQIFRLEELDAEFSVLQTRVDKSSLTAPYRARIGRRYLDEGSVVSSGQPVVEISEIGKREARFSVPVCFLSQVESSHGVHVEGEYLEVAGVRVLDSVSEITRTVDVIIDLENSTHVLEGEVCVLTLYETIEVGGIQVPITALVPSVRGLWSCYRVSTDTQTGESRVVREEVLVSHTDGENAYIETTMPDGALIVSKGAHKLLPGSLVMPTEDAR